MSHSKPTNLTGAQYNSRTRWPKRFVPPADMVNVDEESPEQDHFIVDDNWGELLQLILDYGTERYSLGAQDTMVMMRGDVPVKRHAAGAPDSDILGKIIRKLTRLQREAGDD